MTSDAIIQIDNGSRWLRFEHPVRVLEAWTAGAVFDVLRDVDDLTRSRGWHAVGFISYEAGTAFGLRAHSADARVPLARFGLFEPANVAEMAPPAASAAYELGTLTPSVGRAAYEAAIEHIKQHIVEGESYQVNYTFHLRGAFRGDPVSFFADLVAAQRGRYAAFLRIGRHSICSASPELFFARNGKHVTAQPMKGTARRGRWTVEDEAQAGRLQASPKERAENVMVVDMVRNDLGRIAETGSVEVPELFALERYPNVWQMTSRITARTPATLSEVFAAMHPSASVTGAPKVRTMEIIRALEHEPRGIYTGAIGHVAPGGTAQFNVAIRTAVVDHAAGTLDFGVGSGIVWDSSAAQEYEECLIKAAILGRRPCPFELLETLRWSPGEGFFLLERHLHRLEDSAAYFGFACPREGVRDALDRGVAGSEVDLRVRLLVSQAGRARTQSSRLEPPTEPARVGLAETPIDPADVFLFHKTTNRAQYDDRRNARWDEVIFWNPERHVTEATTANLVVELGGRSVTPPVESGLLAGTFRAELLATGRIAESRVTIEQLQTASRLWLINSVRGWREAKLIG